MTSFGDYSEKTDSARRPVAGLIRVMGRAVAYVALLVAALAALVMIVVPMATGSQTYTVLTSSMAPKYAPGTFLVVKPTAFADLQVGDIITYQIESGKAGVISHRITSVGATQTGERVLTTKGDNNSLADANPVQEAQVKGKLFYAVPYVGLVANAVGQERGTIVPIIAVGFIGFGAFSMIKGSLGKKKARHSARNGQ
jgi:signal peptidase